MWKAFRLLTLDEICHVDREGFVMNSVGKLLFKPLPLTPSPVGEGVRGRGLNSSLSNLPPVLDVLKYSVCVLKQYLFYLFNWVFVHFG